MQPRSPADLDVADAVGGLRLDELGRDPLERLGVLHQRDREVERAEQLGLRRARHRGDERPRHAEPVARRVDAAGPGQLERRIDAQRAIEMEVQLGLGHRLDEPPGRTPIRVWPGSGVGHGPMLRFRPPARPAAEPDRAIAKGSVSTVLVTGASGFVGRHTVPALLAAGHRVVASRAPMTTARAGPTDRRPRRSPGRDAHRRRHPLRDAVVRVRRRRCRRPPRRDPARPRRRREPAPRQHGGHPERRRRHAVGRGAAADPPRCAGDEDDPDLHYASSKAKADALVRSSGLDWTILKPSLQFGPGDGFFNIVADLVRISPGLDPRPRSWRQPLPADRCQRRRADPGRVARGSDDVPPVVRARRTALLDVPRDHARGPRGDGQAPGHHPVPATAHPPRRRHGRAAPPAVPGRDGPASPAPTRQHRASGLDPGTVRVRATRRWRARSATCDGGRPTSVRPSWGSRCAGRPPDARGRVGARVRRRHARHRARRGRDRGRHGRAASRRRPPGADQPRRCGGQPATRRDRSRPDRAGRPGRRPRDPGAWRARGPGGVRPRDGRWRDRPGRHARDGHPAADRGPPGDVRRVADRRHTGGRVRALARGSEPGGPTARRADDDRWTWRRLGAAHDRVGRGQPAVRAAVGPRRRGPRGRGARPARELCQGRQGARSARMPHSNRLGPCETR